MMFLVDFAVKGMVMGIYFGSAPFTPFNMFGSFLSSLLLCPLDRSKWPRCLLWHDLVALGGVACGRLECRLGAYPADTSAFWTPPDHWDADDIALEMSHTPNTWTDSSREDFSSSGGFEVAGAGVYEPASELAFEGSVWGTAEEYGDARRERCRAFMSVPGVVQTVQRAEFWGAIVAMQAYWPCH